MDRHEGGLPRPEDEEREQDEEDAVLRPPGQDAPDAEVERARKDPRPRDREEEERDGRGDEDPQIRAGALHRLPRPVVRDERVGRERQDLVEEEQREQVARERHAHGGADGDREADVEPRLVRLPVSPHVADRVDRSDDPEPGSHQGEEHAEGLQPEHEGEASGEEPHQQDAGGRVGEDVRQQRRHEPEERGAGRERHRFPHVGPPAEQGDEHRTGEGDDQRQVQRHESAHWSPRSTASAACSATPAE